MIRAILGLTAISLLLVSGCKSNKPDISADNDKSATESTAQVPDSSDQSIDKSPIPDRAGDRNNIETVVKQAVADLMIAINQRDFNRLDRYFDIEDPSVSKHLSEEKKSLKENANNSETQIHDVKLVGLQLKDLKLSETQAEVAAIATVSGSIISDGQKNIITQNQEEKIKLRKTKKGWLITEANWNEG